MRRAVDVFVTTCMLSAWDVRGLQRSILGEARDCPGREGEDGSYGRAQRAVRAGRRVAERARRGGTRRGRVKRHDADVCRGD